MNDRFKFRVAIKQADGTYKRYNVISLGRDARGLYVRCLIPHKDNEMYLHDIVIDGENAILEQCTGLKDKNGKLIYDGDVIEFYIGVSPVYVQWNSDKCCFVLQRFDVKGWEISLIQDTASSYAIIGNIHDKEGE